MIDQRSLTAAKFITLNFLLGGGGWLKLAVFNTLNEVKLSLLSVWFIGINRVWLWPNIYLMWRIILRTDHLTTIFSANGFIVWFVIDQRNRWKRKADHNKPQVTSSAPPPPPPPRNIFVLPRLIPRDNSSISVCKWLLVWHHTFSEPPASSQTNSSSLVCFTFQLFVRGTVSGRH